MIIKKIIQRFFILFLFIVLSPWLHPENNKKVLSEKELWIEYVSAYEQNNEIRKKFLIQTYPEWADAYARRLMASYLSFSIKENQEVANKIFLVLQDIAQIYGGIFESPFLLQQSRFYEKLSSLQKRKALQAILTFHQAKTTKNAMHLFNIDSKYGKELDSDQISEELKQEFAKSNHSLSSQSIIGAKDIGKEWLIQDKSQDTPNKYLLISTTQNINIYHIELYQQALLLYRQINDYWSIADILVQLAEQARSQGEILQAIHWYTQSLEFFEKLQDYVNLSRAFNSLGLLAHAQQDYSKAEFYYQNGLQIARKIENLGASASLLNNLGALKKTLGKKDEAKKNFQESLLYYKTLQDTSGIATILNNLGTLYLEEEDYDKASESLEQSLVLTKKLEDEMGVAHTLTILASVASAQKKYHRSLVYLEESLKIARTQKDSAKEDFILSELQNLKKQYLSVQNENEYYQAKLNFAKIFDNPIEIKNAQKRLDEIKKQERISYLKIILLYFPVLLLPAGIFFFWKRIRREH